MEGSLSTSQAAPTIINKKNVISMSEFSDSVNLAELSSQQKKECQDFIIGKLKLDKN